MGSALDVPKSQGHRVNAVAKPRRPRPIVEQVAKVRIASAASDFAITIAATRLSVPHILLGDRLPEARPAGA